MIDLSLTPVHKALNAKMVDYAGFNMPVQYEGVIAEHLAVRNNVGVFDVSHMGEIFISGKGADQFLQYITSNDVSTLINGKVQYSCLPNDDNGIVDDVLVYKIDYNSYLLVVNASNIEKDLAWLNTNNSFGCKIDNQSNFYSLLAVQGPKSLDLLNQLSVETLNEIEYYNFIIGSISGIDNVIISRTGYTGELGFELYVKNEYALDLWNSLFSLEIDIKPIGLAARNTLRLEKGFCLYGNDIDDNTSPLEANLGWITKLNTNFINSEFLINQKSSGLDRKLVGFEVLDRGIARNGYEVYCSNKNIIGIVTSGSMSPSLNKAIGMAYINIKHIKIGNDILIKVRNKFLNSRIIETPFL
jgi:aminomethyltransferase